mgnify:CR=1 FL=1
MRVLKHFKNVAVAYVKQLTCKHAETASASCPVTGMTYVRCTNCWKRVEVFKTEENS